MPPLSRSLRLKLLATVIAAVVFVLLYEKSAIDSRLARIQEASPTDAPVAGRRVRFEVTAYCKGETTASGMRVRSGIAAADPKLLPSGSVIQVDGLPEPYQGIYIVLDTGPAIQGRILDLYMWSCYDALSFGRRDAEITVLRLGWSPKGTSR